MKSLKKDPEEESYAVDTAEDGNSEFTFHSSSSSYDGPSMNRTQS